MNAGRMDRRVQFLRAGIIDDGLQERLGPHVPYGSPVWASKTPISDGERFRADTVAQDRTDRFVVRYSALTASITGKDRLVCEGVTYGIAGRKEIGRREGIEITASRVDAV
ncbi:head-tail adaptor protein [Paracoccus hibiscisoli]|uniref:head-tail adaptor protein n=1 Tax=Paracoccus hibiscisoli TaxID=2023261 RepID=UPI0023F516A3|nr:head-tail adaptor protein [Paracoccus hibiscisoli]